MSNQVYSEMKWSISGNASVLKEGGANCSTYQIKLK